MTKNAKIHTMKTVRNYQNYIDNYSEICNINITVLKHTKK